MSRRFCKSFDIPNPESTEPEAGLTADHHRMMTIGRLGSFGRGLPKRKTYEFGWMVPKRLVHHFAYSTIASSKTECRGIADLCRPQYYFCEHFSGTDARVAQETSYFAALIAAQRFFWAAAIFLFVAALNGFRLGASEVGSTTAA